MSSASLRRLDEHVDANLTQRTLVADFAAVARLPAQVFAQAYMRCNGRSPRQYVLTQRVHRATAMLHRSDIL